MSEQIERDQKAWSKDETAFIVHDATCLETRLERLDGFITPNDYFFVRNNGPTPVLDADAYRLVVEGDAVDQPLMLTMADLRKLPSRTLFAYLECAGNQRAMFELVMGRPTDDAQWKTGAVGNAAWTGVPLCELLQRAGVQNHATDVMLIGLDAAAPEGGFRRSMPIAKAWEADTLLAHTMNGAPLPVEHGFPLRAIVPGWIGCNSIKWLGRIVVSSQKQWSRNNTSYYVMIGDAYPQEGEASGQVCTLQSIKSALALPWPAQLPAGMQTLHGYAHSPHARIARVEWSGDGGATWHDARLPDAAAQAGLHYAWARFEFDWKATPGTHTIQTRATDAKGHIQPATIPFNKKGYLFNQPLPHPVTVA